MDAALHQRELTPASASLPSVNSTWWGQAQIQDCISLNFAKGGQFANAQGYLRLVISLENEPSQICKHSQTLQKVWTGLGSCGCGLGARPQQKNIFFQSQTPFSAEKENCSKLRNLHRNDNVFGYLRGFFFLLFDRPNHACRIDEKVSHFLQVVRQKREKRPDVASQIPPSFHETRLVKKTHQVGFKFDLL